MAKIHLSTDELKLMQNSDLILTKNRIIEKINEALGELQLRMQPEIRNRTMIYEGFERKGAKISRGERYMGLPYLILDYPRLFDKENILAIRTFFWWGSYCSITLHVNGLYQPWVAKRLLADFQRYTTNGYFVSLSGDEWCHDVHSEDYIPVGNLHTGELVGKLTNATFLKLTAKVGFDQWNNMEARLFHSFLELLKLMED